MNIAICMRKSFPGARAFALILTAGWMLPHAGLRAAEREAGKTDAEVTYTRDVAPIFRSQCENCHRPGEVAPMSLRTWDEVRPWAKSIRQNVLDRTMPPWGAAPTGHSFSNDMSLSETEIDTVVRWIDQGAPRGDEADLPPPLPPGDADAWILGEPDYFFQAAEEYTVRTTEQDEDLYQCLLIPTGLDHDIWVDGLEYRIGNREVTHHIVAFVDLNGKAAAKDAELPGYGFPCGMGRTDGLASVTGLDSMLGGWGPGVPPNRYHEGTARLIPAGAHLLFQMHYYNQSGATATDRPGVGVHVAKGPVRARARTMAVIAPPFTFRIPAGEAEARNSGGWNVPRDIFIYSMAPHMHNLGRSMSLEARHPDGTRDMLLDVRRFDFNWQRTYVLSEPVLVPAKSRIVMESVHDNSSANPANPFDPPIDMKWGESTSEEMSIGFIGYWFADENLNLPARGEPETASGA